MRRLLGLCAVLVAALAITFLPAEGRDVSDLQDLIDAAEPGDTIELGRGTYEGGVTIDKSLTILGVDRPVVDVGGSGNGFVITAPDVTVRGLVVRNTGDSIDQENAAFSVNAARARIVDNRLEDVLFGIYMRKATDSLVSGNVIGAKDLHIARRGDGIRIWESSGVTVEKNTVHGGRDSVMWFSDDLTVRDNDIRGGRYGLHFMYSDNATIDGNWLEGNSVGTFLMYSRRLSLVDNVFYDNRGPSGYGVGLKDMDGVEAAGNRFVENRIGLSISNSPWSSDVHQHFTGNLFAYNDLGVSFDPSVRRNHFSHNAFVDNREQVGLSGAGRLRGNEWSEEDVGNYWSDFAGYDADSDGIGDVSYRIDDLFSQLTDDNPELTLFSETPAARAVDLAAAAFPALRPEPKVEDEAPLSSMPDFDTLPGDPPQRSPLPTIVTGLALLLVAALLVAFSGAYRLPGTGRHLVPEGATT